MIGPITFDAKCAGARSAGNPHAACDVAGAGNGVTDLSIWARRGKPWIQTSECPAGLPRQLSTLPFKPRSALNRYDKRFYSFSPAIGDKASKALRREMRHWGLERLSRYSLDELRQRFGPRILDWIRYYRRFTPSAVQRALHTLDYHLVRWAQRKYKRLRRHKTHAWNWLAELQRREPALFPHWTEGIRAAGR
jgi:hypothetical protein